jgi:hypothetical protein
MQLVLSSRFTSLREPWRLGPWSCGADSVSQRDASSSVSSSCFLLGWWAAIDIYGLWALRNPRSSRPRLVPATTRPQSSSSSPPPNPKLATSFLNLDLPSTVQFLSRFFQARGAEVEGGRQHGARLKTEQWEKEGGGSRERWRRWRRLEANICLR